MRRFLLALLLVAPATFAQAQNDGASAEGKPSKDNAVEVAKVQAANEALARQAGEILRRNCARCHKGEGSESGYAFNVLNVASLEDEGMLSAGDPESSEIYDIMFRGRMPPRNRPQLPRPSPEHVDIVKKWIAAGAPAIPAPKPRSPIALKTELTQIYDHLQKNRQNRDQLRYFSLTHLYNDPTVEDAYLQVARQALFKTLNSLSWEPALATPVAINAEQTIYAVELDKLGWRREHWIALLKDYPYGLSYGSLDDASISEIDNDISDLRRDKTMAVLRADWVTAVATKPPLYYQILFDLHLPELRARTDAGEPVNMTDADLEQHLGVDAMSNIFKGRAQRSGFTESGVSGQNRLIERHPTKSTGFYWKSYDFKSSNRTAILSEFPLGPAFKDNPFADLAFSHDGGEIIFSLPNGLQGYLLVDAQGGRIDAGPIEVVADSLKTSGNEQIVAGVSCIACHRAGMIESPDDEVRQFSGAVNDAREKVRELYPVNATFRQLLKDDGRSFVRNLQKLLDPLVDGAKVDSLPEPIGEVARRYHLEPMQLETVAAELSVSPARLRGVLENDPVLRRLGLRVLLRDGGTIKRAAWSSPAIFPLMKQTARQLGYDPR